jgi:hypothetical protein
MKTGQKTTRRWFHLLSYFLAVIAVLSLIALIIIRWADTRILDTDTWVSTVGPLPKDPDVSSALATYTISTILNEQRTEARIKQVLPPRADFLASPLYDQLNSRATKRAQQFISSDQFQSIWVGANRLAMAGLLATARGSAPPANPNGQTRLQLGLSQLKSKITSSIVSFSDSDAEPDIAVGLKTKIRTFKTVVRSADFANAVVPYLAVAATLGALATAANRKRQLLIIFGSSAVASLLMLIGLKMAKSSVVSQVKHEVYRPAVTKIVDALSANLRTMIINLFILSLVIIALALSGRFLWARFNHWLPGYKRSSFYSYVYVFRSWIGKYFRYILGGFTAIILLYLAFTASQFGWAKIINSILFISSIASLMVLIKSDRIARRSAKA